MNCFRALQIIVVIVLLAEAINSAPAQKGKVSQLWKQHGGEGDIVELWKKDKKAGGGAAAFGLKSTSDRRWKVKDSEGNTIIPYSLSEAFSDNEVKEIELAMHSLSTNTCVHFVEKSEEKYTSIPDKPNDNYIEIVNTDPGCYAYPIGWDSGRNYINLEGPTAQDEGNCASYGVVIHELMHKIGFWHEHMRPDRDEYIKILWDNVNENMKSQFTKVGEEDPSDRAQYHAYSQYEYLSIMHYPTNTFAKDPSKPTMEPLKADERTMELMTRDRTEATLNDYYAICEMYQCKQCMGKPFPPPHSGTDPDSGKPFPPPHSGTDPDSDYVATA